MCVFAASLWYAGIAMERDRERAELKKAAKAAMGKHGGNDQELWCDWRWQLRFFKYRIRYMLKQR